MFEILDHTADIGIRASGPTLAGALRETALGMFSIIGDPGGGHSPMTVEVVAEGHDNESVLHGLLSELLYIHETEGFFLTDLDLEMDGMAVKGTARGCPASLATITTEIKAVTYHRLRVERDSEGWVCEVLFDV